MLRARAVGDPVQGLEGCRGGKGPRLVLGSATVRHLPMHGTPRCSSLALGRCPRAQDISHIGGPGHCSVLTATPLPRPHPSALAQMLPKSLVLSLDRDTRT